MVVKCKIINLNSTQTGSMFVPKEKFTFEDLILWVYRNCPGDRKVVIEQGNVQAHYDDRVEIYYLEN
jgi:hypothetical protein